MDITQLAKKLLNDNQLQKNKTGLSASIHSFQKLLDQQESIAFYFDKKSRMNLLNTVYLVNRITAEFNYRGKVELIYYKDTDSEKLLQQCLRFFRTEGKYTHHKISEAADKIDFKAKIVFCGGSDHLDSFWNRLPQTVSYILSTQPFLDSTKQSFCKIRHPKQGLITHFIDTIAQEQEFHLRPYFVDSDQTKNLTDDVKNYWQSQEKFSPAVQRAEKLIAEKSLDFFPVSGLVTSDASSDRGSNTILLLALALLKAADTSKSQALIFTDYTSTADPHFSLLKYFCQKEKDGEALLTELLRLFPLAKEEELRAGLLGSLLEQREQLGNKLDRIVFWEDTITIEPGKLYLCPVGELPQDYLDYLYANSTFLFFEDYAVTNLAVNLGIPYLQKSIAVSAKVYPEWIDSEISNKMQELSNIFSQNMASYTTGVNKSFSQEIKAISQWLQAPERAYFAALKENAQKCLTNADRSKTPADKLTAMITTFEPLRESQEQPTPVEPSKNRFGALYDQLKEQLTKEHTLDIRAAVKKQKIEKISDFLGSFSLDKSFTVTLTDNEQIQLCYKNEQGGQGEACAVKILKAKHPMFLGDLTLCFSSWKGESDWVLALNGSSSEVGLLTGIPWLKLVDISFGLTIINNNAPVTGYIGGSIGKSETFSGLRLIMGLNKQEGKLSLSAQPEKPITSEAVLQTFGKLAGGINFMQLLPAELQQTTKLGLTSMKIYYDTQKNKLASLCFDFANHGSAWVLWQRENQQKLVAQPTFNLTVINPEDLKNRQITLKFGSFVNIVDIQEEDSIVKFWLEAAYPPLQAEMRLVSGQLELKKLLQWFGHSGKLEGFAQPPSITELTALADFAAKKFVFSSGIDLKWKISDQFEVKQLALEVISQENDVSLGFAGRMKIIDDVEAAVAVFLDKDTVKILTKVALNNEISMEKLVNYYSDSKTLLTTKEGFAWPKVADLSINLEKKADKAADFTIAVHVEDWPIAIGKYHNKLSAKGELKRKDSKFEASLNAAINLLGAKMKLELSYQIDQKDSQLSLHWGDFTGIINNNQVVIKLNDFSVGDMIETFTGWLYGSSFKLDPPWDLLYEIKLDMDLNYDFTNEQFQVKISQNMLESKQVKKSRTFGKLEKIEVTYNPKPVEKNGKVAVSIKYHGQDQPFCWDAAKPGTAPAPPGSGINYFKLNYLALGQRTQLFPKDYNPVDIGSALAELKKNATPEKIPGYAGNIGLLIASEFSIFKESGEDYFLKAQIIFYDPQLYGLKIQLAGKAAKMFAGLSFEVLYAKLSEALGVFKSRLVLPDKYRSFDIGAFAISLPDFYIEVYTNGDFYIDLGFPKNGDFSRSFTMSGIVPPGLPILGSAGVYFGKLSNESAKHRSVHLPATNNGQFNPVIAFGVGLRFGLGKSINYGPLSGGFVLVVQTILEGVFAKWQPNQVDPNQTEGWYYYLKGSAGLVGNVYGKIDFGVINIGLNVLVSLSVEFVFESGHEIPITFEANLNARASLTLGFGCFKVTLSFDFSFKMKEHFVIGHNATMPWDSHNHEIAMTVKSNPKQVVNIDLTNFVDVSNAEKQTLKIWPMLVTTLALDEHNLQKKVPIGNVMFMLEPEDFEKLLEKIKTGIYRVACEAANGDLSDDELLAGIEAAVKAGSLTADICEAFLAEYFELEFMNQQSENELEIAGVYFPIPPSTKIVCEQLEIDYLLKDYNQLGANALSRFAEIFKETAILTQEEQNQNDQSNAETSLSMAEYVFADWFAIATKYLAHEMRQALLVESAATTLDNFTVNEKAKELGGMISRFSLHGMRFPTTKELVIPKIKGLWVKETEQHELELPAEAGLFALTGQALCLPNQKLTVTVSLAAEMTKTPQTYTLIKGEKAELVVMDEQLFTANDEPIHVERLRKEQIFKPEMIEFTKPITMTQPFIWEKPQALLHYFAMEKPVYPAFEFKLFNSKGEKQAAIFNHLMLVEISLYPTERSDSYLIGQASEKSIQGLKRIIKGGYYPRKISYLSDGKLLDAQIAIAPMNLSTETRPSEMNANSETKHTVELLWQALVTNNQGYVLTFLDKKRQSAETVEEELKVTLVLSYPASPSDSGDPAEVYGNAVMADNAVTDPYTLVASGIAKEFNFSYRGEGLAEILDQIECCDYGRIAAANQTVALTPRTSWYYPASDSTGKIVLEKAISEGQETLASFAQKLNIPAATLLYHNRQQKRLFATTKLLLIIHAGTRFGQGSENTDSLINERILIQRQQLRTDVSLSDQSGEMDSDDVASSHVFLRYRIANNKSFSVPYADKGAADIGLYDLVVPLDKACGGSYQAQGNRLPVTFEWIDYYGNRLFSGFTETCFAGYQDPLQNLNRWPGIKATWTFKDIGKIGLAIAFDSTFFQLDADGELRNNTIKKYEEIKTQLTDPNVKLSFKCHLYKESLSVPANKLAILKLSEEILDFCKQEKHTKVPSAELEWSFSEENRSEDILVPLESSLSFSRDGFVAIGFEDVANIMETTALVNLPEDLQQFTTNFQHYYPEYQVLKGGAAENDLVAFATTDMTIQLSQEKAQIYLPQPLTNRLHDQDEAQIRVYHQIEGKMETERQSFRNIDLNRWLQDSLAFAERLLTAQNVAAALKMDVDLQALLDVKVKLAETLSNRLLPAYVDDTAAVSPATQKQFEQRLRSSLSSFFDSKAIIAIPGTVSGLPDQQTAFYGQLTSVDDHIPNLSYSPAKMVNGKQNECIFVISHTGLVTNREGAVLPHAELNLLYSITHLETERTKLIDDFASSKWLSGFQQTIHEEKIRVTIPFPLVDFPETAKLIKQSSEKVEENQEAGQWRYGYTYSRTRHYPQQISHMTVQFNPTKQGDFLNNLDTLFSALASIQLSQAAILQDLEAATTAEKLQNMLAIAADLLAELNTALGQGDNLSSEKLNHFEKDSIAFEVHEGVDSQNNRFTLTIKSDKKELESKELIAGIQPEIPHYSAERQGEIWYFKDEQGGYLTASAGQLIPERKMILPPIPILKKQAAIAKVTIEQNRSLNKQLRNEFIFTTGTTAFESPLYANCVVKEVILECKGQDREKLSVILGEYLQSLVQDATVMLQAKLMVSSQLYEGVEPVIYPVLMQVKEKITGGDFSKLLQKWETVLLEWRKPFAKNNQLEFSKKDELHFELVFFATEHEAPLLIIKNARIRGDKLQLM